VIRPGRPAEPSDQELVGLVKSLPSGDPQREAAFEALVARYEPVIRSCVHRYSDSPEPTEDLTQVAYLGLLKAINNYDPDIGDNLAAYAYPCVIGEIRRHFRDTRWQVRVRRAAQELRLEILAATAELTQELARTPSDEELARHLRVAEADIAEAQSADRVFQSLSLDAPVYHDGSDDSLGDQLGGDDPLLDHAVDRHTVWACLGELPRREQRLLMMRFYGNMTQEQIAAHFGISQMHVSRLLSRSLRYLRDRMEQSSDDSSGASGKAG
jgi:RNA polymerase sigma-B factor